LLLAIKVEKLRSQLSQKANSKVLGEKFLKVRIIEG